MEKKEKKYCPFGKYCDDECPMFVFHNSWGMCSLKSIALSLQSLVEKK